MINSLCRMSLNITQFKHHLEWATGMTLENYMPFCTVSLCSLKLKQILPPRKSICSITSSRLFVFVKSVPNIISYIVPKVLDFAHLYASDDKCANHSFYITNNLNQNFKLYTECPYNFNSEISQPTT